MQRIHSGLSWQVFCGSRQYEEHSISIWLLHLGHFCLGVIYSRADTIVSVISDVQLFVAEKWRIASDKRGSGNTANIGSIQRITDIISGNGMFSNLGEDWFDDYWMNYGKITIKTESGDTEKITSLKEFVDYRGGDTSLIVPRNNRQ